MDNLEFDSQEVAGSLCEYYESKNTSDWGPDSSENIWQFGYPITRAEPNAEVIAASLQKLRQIK